MLTEYSLYVLFDGVSSFDDSIDLVRGCKEFISTWHKNYLQEKNGLQRLIYNMNLQAVKFPFKGKTTCSALLLDYRSEKAFVVNIGDSRVYTLSNSYLEPVTKDDSLAIQPNVLTKCVGMKDLDYKDFAEEEFDLNQHFLLCTDGFYTMMNANLKRYFKVFQFKRKLNLMNAILKLQLQKNKDDSTYILIKRDGI